jgi:hypothetical protein
MVLAGGALASMACGNSTTGAGAASDAGSQPADATTDQAASDEVANECCNGNPDPCCCYQFCACSLTPQCVQEMECQEAGRWDAMSSTCEAPPNDAGPRDADSSTSDASGDAPEDAADGTD